MTEILDEAKKLTNGSRNKDYGHPLEDFSKVKHMAKPILEAERKGTLHPALAHALYMVQVKIARLCNTPDHLDSIIDGAGYFNTYNMILQKLEEEQEQTEKQNIFEEMHQMIDDFYNDKKRISLIRKPISDDDLPPGIKVLGAELTDINEWPVEIIDRAAERMSICKKVAEKEGLSVNEVYNLLYGMDIEKNETITPPEMLIIDDNLALKLTEIKPYGNQIQDQ